MVCAPSGKQLLRLTCQLYLKISQPIGCALEVGKRFRVVQRRSELLHDPGIPILAHNNHRREVLWAICGKIAGDCELMHVRLSNSLDPISRSRLGAKSDQTKGPAAIQLVNLTREDDRMIIYA